MTEPGPPDADADADTTAQPYGASPARRVLDAVYFRPAWAALAVELLFILIVCNQWAVDHIALPGGLREHGWVRQSVDELIASFSWRPTPSGGYKWLWLATLVRAVFMPLFTFLLLRWAGRARRNSVTPFETVGAVFLAGIVAVIAGRIVTYPDLTRYYRDFFDQQAARPSFGRSVFSSTEPPGTALAILIMALLAAVAVSRFAAKPSSDAVDVPVTPSGAE